jgi:hypothetical protein
VATPQVSPLAGETDLGEAQVRRGPINNYNLQ